ncbi:Hint domain-containing protein [Actibacterium sp. MT2.3-13A]|uniref:Hint domain-containing protein n=1 Tax=Actibacterium sp. MT2.3-13A TaxID=2828332 RepID=UPI001BAD9226|nr:Hint domain-containing protein [Actibacterium sp. MT2.3-13A]
MGRKNEIRGAGAHDQAELDEAWVDAIDHGAHPAADMTAGLVVGTMVATEGGWRAVETLREGDKVMTFDGGLQPVGAIKHGVLWAAPMLCPEPLWPLSVPKGALGNSQPMTLLPDQPMLVESDAAEDIYGDPFVLVPANVLDGRFGIGRLLPVDPVEVVALGFENDEIVYVNGSALAFCPSHIAGTVLTLDELASESEILSEYHVLTPMEARAVLGEARSGAPGDTPEPDSHAA